MTRQCLRLPRINASRPLLLQEDDKEDKECAYTMKSPVSLQLVRQTRMGQLCYPDRGGGGKGGSLTKVRRMKGYGAWGGSNVTGFAMRPGARTPPHVDQQVVFKDMEILPAAGIMTPVRRDEAGPAKRAILVCAHDKEQVVTLLGLKVSEPSATQYTGNTLHLEDLAELLQERGILFVVANFPAACSYAIPCNSVHAFITLRLTETCAWHPSI